jgi:hypothetical protein
MGATNHTAEVPTVSVAILTEESDLRLLNVRAAVRKMVTAASQTARKSVQQMSGAMPWNIASLSARP